MNQPQLYSESNDMQVADATYVLNKYFHVIQWKTDGGDNIIDIGCGDGRVTAELLYPLLPKSTKKLVAIDISHEMIEFAKVHFSRENLSYMQFDIGTKELDGNLREKFQHVFSFHCLQWVKDQRQCAFNLYDMLQPGGDMFVIFLAKDIMYEIYQNLSKHKIWADYMKDIKKYDVCPYYYFDDPAKEFRNLLSYVGFDVHICKIISRSYTFKDIFSWKKWAMSVNPFLGQMPDNLKENYINDILNEMRERNYTVLNKHNNEETIEARHTMFMVYASKPVKKS